MKYKHVGDHAEDLADGRMVAPGEVIELDEEQVRDPRHEDLLANGIFIGVDDDAEHEAQLAERRVTGRTKRQEAAAAEATEEETNGK